MGKTIDEVFDQYGNYKFPDYSNSQYMHNVITTRGEARMTIDFTIEEEDIVKEVCLTVSPIEYLVISAALKQFVENPNNHKNDIDVARRMRKAIENHGNVD